MIELLKKHNYLVDIRQQESGKGISAHFPNQDLINPKFSDISASYSLQSDKKGCLIYVQKIVGETTKHFDVHCPDYAARLYVSCDLMLILAELSLSPNIVTYADKVGGEAESLYSILQIEEEYREKEDLLAEIYVHSQANGFDKSFDKIAKKNKVAEGYQLLRRNFGG